MVHDSINIFPPTERKVRVTFGTVVLKYIIIFHENVKLKLRISEKANAHFKMSAFIGYRPTLTDRCMTAQKLKGASWISNESYDHSLLAKGTNCSCTVRLYLGKNYLLNSIPFYK